MKFCMESWELPCYEYVEHDGSSNCNSCQLSYLQLLIGVYVFSQCEKSLQLLINVFSQSEK